MQAVPKSFFITGLERSEIERVNENLHDATYRPNYSQFMELIERADAQRDGERADAICARREGDWQLADYCERRVEEIENVVSIWRQRWEDCAR
jgi:hypothetical protein